MGIFSRIVSSIVKNYYIHIKRDTIGYCRKIGVRIGSDCQILADPNCFGTEPWLIKIGDHVDITGRVQFLTHEGGIWYARGIDKKYNELDSFSPIVVGNNVIIGFDSLIMPGVHIGNNVIIAARSVVTKDVPDGFVVAGVPAKQINTTDAFFEKFSKKEFFPTKHLSQKKKKLYLLESHPEWFD